MTAIAAVLHRCDFCKRERPRNEMLLGSNHNDRFLLSLRGFDGRQNGTPWPTAMCLNDRTACDAIHDSAV